MVASRPKKKTKMDEAAVSRTVREEHPTHLQLKIESFSLISSSSLVQYYSDSFQAGGYKWKLCLYPKGNKKENGEGHISLYLEMVVTDSLSPGWEVHALFRLFVLDQRKDNYLTLQDGNGKPRRFRAEKTSHGFERLITLEEFKEPKNGYLVNDVCVFGAEIFVQRENVSSRVERLLVKTEVVDCTHTWKIKKFSELVQEYHFSDIFTAGGFKWKIKIFPEGYGEGKGKSLSLFLELESKNSTKLIPAQGVYAKNQLRIMDQINTNHKEFNGTKGWFSDSAKTWGWTNYIALSSFKDQSNGYLVNDVCIIEAHVTFIGTIEKCICL